MSVLAFPALCTCYGGCVCVLRQYYVLAVCISNVLAGVCTEAVLCARNGWLVCVLRQCARNGWLVCVLRQCARNGRLVCVLRLYNVLEIAGYCY